MVTPAKLAANRRNAQLSSGPKTPEGRARSAQNATKHGLFAKNPVFPTENPEDYQALREQHFQEFEPVGTLETELVERVISAAWRMGRFARIEAEIISIEYSRIEDGVEENRLGLAFLRRENGTNAIARLYRYEMALERSFYRALKALAQLQEARKSAGTNPPTEEEMSATLSSKSDETNPPPPDTQYTEEHEGPPQAASGAQPGAEGFRFAR